MMFTINNAAFKYVAYIGYVLHYIVYGFIVISIVIVTVRRL